MSHRVTKTVVLCVAPIICWATYSPSANPDDQVPVSLDVGVHTKDVWRGWLYSEDPVHQHFVWAGIGKFGISLFSCYDLRGQRGWTEHDYGLSYSTTRGSLRWEFSCVYYDPSEPNSDSWELCARAEFADSLWGPSLAVCQDFGRGNGTYIELGASWDLRLTSRLGFNLLAAVGYNHHQWREASSLSQLVLRAELPLSSSRSRWTIVPAVTFWRSLDRRDYSNHVVFGISVRS